MFWEILLEAFKKSSWSCLEKYSKNWSDPDFCDRVGGGVGIAYSSSLIVWKLIKTEGGSCDRGRYEEKGGG